MNSFDSQTAVVSGATRGIGKAISEALLEKGAYVIALYAGNEESATSFAKENASYKDQFEVVRCDVADGNGVAELFTHLENTRPSLDILVNNAGIRRDSVLALMKEEDWRAVLDVNLLGSYHMAKAAVPLMMQNKYGRIITITSPSAYLGFAGQSNYAASKAGQIALTKSLAKEVGRKKITVNCVSPGFIDTDFIKDLPAEQLKEYKRMVPLRRFGTPAEVAKAVLFLAGRDAGYITGSVLEITGGL